MTPRSATRTVAPMIAFVLLGSVPPLLVLALAGMIYLTWIEVRREPISRRGKLWWLMLVALFNIVGYAAMRIALAVWRGRGRPSLGRTA